MTKTESSVASSQAKKQPLRRRCLEGFSRIINGFLERVFDKLGRFTARRPAVVICLSILLAAILGSGMLQLETESRGEKLWVPDDNESQDSNDFVEEYFPSPGRLESFHLRRRDGGNILTPAAFDRFLELHNRLVQVAWENNGEINYLPDTVNFTTLCLNIESGEGAQDFRDCVIQNPIELFSYDPQSWDTEEKILNTVNNPSSWNQALAGRGATIGSVVGGAERDANNQIQSAKVLGGSYFLAANQTLYEAQKEDTANREWEQVYLDAFEEEDANDQTYMVNRFTGRSFDDEFGSTINSDIALLQIAIILLFIYTCIAISHCADGFVGRRIGLVIAGFVNIALAIFSSYGFCSYLGLFFTDLMSILPFIMLGVGVDGMFVIATALDVTSEDLPMEERMAQAMRHGGVSVAVASITNFGAFMIGSNTSLPALAAFSIYAAFGLLFNLVYQVTFFAACLVLDKQREINRRWDLCCCVKSTRERNAGMCGGFVFPGFPSKKLSTVVMTWLGKQYAKMPVRIGVVVAWLVLLGVGISGTAMLEVGADVNNFVPSGSYLEDWINTVEADFTATGTTVHLYWVSNEQVPIDFTSPQIQAQMDTSLNLYRDNEWVVPETVESWWEAFREFQNGTVSQATFYSDLEMFLNGPGSRYSGDIVYNTEGVASSGIRTARSAFNWRYLEDTNDQIDAMNSMRKTADQIPLPLGENAFPYSDDFLDIEQYKAVLPEAITNIGLGFLMIAIVVLILVSHPVAALLTFICVASAIIELTGFLIYRGSYVDSVTVIFLVISLGLAVDYSVHYANGYLAMRVDDPVERMQKTLSTTGAAIINGAISTLIAGLTLSGSASYVFETFFYAILFIVICGAFQGLVVLPVLLDIFRPTPYASSFDEESASKSSSEMSQLETNPEQLP